MSEWYLEEYDAKGLVRWTDGVSFESVLAATTDVRRGALARIHFFDRHSATPEQLQTLKGLGAYRT